MPNSTPLQQLETTARALRLAIASDDFAAAADLTDTFQKDFGTAWRLCPAERAAFLQTTLDGMRLSLSLSIERREAIRHQLDLMNGCQDATAAASSRRSLSVSG